MYICDYIEVTLDDIEKAFETGNARLMRSYGDGGINTTVSITGQDLDTRGMNFSAWEDVWTQIPRDLNSVLRIAKC